MHPMHPKTPLPDDLCTAGEVSDYMTYVRRIDGKYVKGNERA